MAAARRSTCSVTAAVLMTLLCLPARAHAAPATTAPQLYQRMMQAMHALPALPPYLRYNASLTFTDNGSTKRRDFLETIRTSDGVAYSQEFENGVPTGTHSSGAVLAFSVMAAFRRRPQMPQADASGAVPTIAAIEVVPMNYSLTLLDPQDTATCAGAFHLRLTPLRDPVKYNLREIWIDPRTFHVCKARADTSNVYFTNHPTGDTVLDVNADGYVTRSETTYDTRFFFRDHKIDAVMTFANIAPAPPPGAK